MLVRDLELQDWGAVPESHAQAGQIVLLRDNPEPSRNLIAVTDGGALVGVCGWRVTDDGVKAVAPIWWLFEDRPLLAMFKHIIRLNPGAALWCKWLPESAEWAKAIGLVADTDEPAEDGAIIFRFTAEQAETFANA